VARAVLDPLAVRRTLKAEGLRARHARSQNFLADPEVLQAILDLADVSPGRRVLEIGPGLGILTGGLLAGGAAVTAIELDAELAAYLRRRFAEDLADDHLRLVEGDALDEELLELVESPF
jgi:16S rRNA (adenine1518-N6/adenine1519-N6)-dimethyltransferase